MLDILEGLVPKEESEEETLEEPPTPDADTKEAAGLLSFEIC
jgi:hypothetical protein